MSYEKSYSRTSGSEVSTFAVLMRNVYTWMTCALMMTGLTAMIVARNADWVMAIATNSVLLWTLLIAEIGLVFFISFCLNKISFITAGLFFALYAILNGVTMSFIMLVYTAESIAQAFFVTAATFGGMSLYGYFTKRDLTGIGRVLIMGLWGLIVATLVNLFWHNDTLTSILNYAGVIIFVGLTAYDTQKIKGMLTQAQYSGVNDQTNKLALLGSIVLYLDFINLFLKLLSIMGKRK